MVVIDLATPVRFCMIFAISLKITNYTSIQLNKEQGVWYAN